MAVQQVLEMQIAGMTPVTPWLRQGSAAVFFQGERRTARFLSRYSLANRSRSGLYLIEYQITEDADGVGRLLLNETPVGNVDEVGALLVGSGQLAAGVNPQFAPFEESGETRVVVEGITGARFEYYRPVGPQEPGGWTPEWRMQGYELPRAMAIRFDAEATSDRLRPVEIVASIEHLSRPRR
jgi:hypothetical protein